MTRQTGDLIHFLVQRDAFLQVLELHRAANFGENGKRVRIPLNESLSELYRAGFGDLDLGAIHHRIALAFAAFFIHDCDRALTIHDHQVARLGLHGLQVDKAHGAVALGIEA